MVAVAVLVIQSREEADGKNSAAGMGPPAAGGIGGSYGDLTAATTGGRCMDSAAVSRSRGGGGGGWSGVEEWWKWAAGGGRLGHLGARAFR